MNIFTITLFTGQQNCLPLGYGAFALIPQGPAQQKPWRPCWCSRQKSLILKIILDWNTNIASCANAIHSHKTTWLVRMFDISIYRKYRWWYWNQCRLGLLQNAFFCHTDIPKFPIYIYRKFSVYRIKFTHHVQWPCMWRNQSIFVLLKCKVKEVDISC